MDEFPPLVARNPFDTFTVNICIFWTALNASEFKIHDEDDLDNLFRDVIISFRTYYHSDICDENLLCILENVFCILFYVRDISHGLGRRSLFYRMMSGLYDTFPLLALSVYPILLGYYKPLPYGCWRDVVGLCAFLKTNTSRGEDHPLVDASIRYMVHILRTENTYFMKSGKCSSTLVKWIPREKSKQGWIYDRIVYLWSWNGLCDSGTKRVFRKMTSKMRASLDLIETHMCSQSWQQISPFKLTNGACSKYWRALCCQTASHTYNHNSSNRIECASRLTRHLETVVDRYDRLNERIENLPFVFPSTMGKYVSYALQCIREKDDMTIMSTISADIYRLNCKWRRMRSCWKRKYPPHFYFPVIRITDSLWTKETCDTIGRALLLYESARGKLNGIYYDGHNPEWIVLDRNQSFLSHIETIYLFLRDRIIPSNTNHPVSCPGKIPLYIQNGTCCLENPNTFVGQTRCAEYDDVFDVMSAVLSHERYDYVRNKFRLIVREQEQ
jgi:hypothetical protein